MRWWQVGEEDPRSLADEGIEVWTAADPQNAHYAVSNFGRAMSATRGSWRPMTLSQTSSGYIAFNFGRSAGISGLAHRVVVRAFDGPAPSPQHTDVRHLDGVGSNNVLTNLCWGTRSENMLDVVRHRREAGERQREEKIAECRETNTWYGGRSWDENLVATVLALEAEGHIQLTHAARILDVTDDVVRRLVRDSVAPRVSQQTRRTSVQREAIIALLAQGCDRTEINRELNETLNHQELYYYATLLRQRGGEVPKAKRVHGGAHAQAKFTEADLARAFDAIVAGQITSVLQFREALNISQGIAYAILRGSHWTHVPRPEGWDDALRRIMPRYRAPSGQNDT